MIYMLWAVLECRSTLLSPGFSNPSVLAPVAIEAVRHGRAIFHPARGQVMAPEACDNATHQPPPVDPTGSEPPVDYYGGIVSRGRQCH
jgi:hypothetical protein